MKTFRFLAVAFVAIAFVACQAAPPTEEQASSPQTTSAQEQAPVKGQAYVDDGVSEKNALQVAGSLDDFSTLAAAVMAAGVENSLANNGPLTVFAPTNSAFEKLPAGTVETLLKPENKSKLSFILVHHVAPSNFPLETLEKNVEKNRKLYMASGKYLEVTKEGDDLFVGGTKILKTVRVSNGWIHVIDDVLLPQE